AARWRPPRRRLARRGPAGGWARAGDPARSDPLQHIQLAAVRRRDTLFPRRTAELNGRGRTVRPEARSESHGGANERTRCIRIRREPSVTVVDRGGWRNPRHGLRASWSLGAKTGPDLSGACSVQVLGGWFMPGGAPARPLPDRARGTARTGARTPLRASRLAG